MIGRVGWVDKALNAFRVNTAGEETREEAIAELHDVLNGVVTDFSAYGARLLGVVKRRDSVFSEPAEFIAKILAGGADVEMPLPRMSLATVCSTRQIFFGKSSFLK